MERYEGESNLKAGVGAAMGLGQAGQRLAQRAYPGDDQADRFADAVPVKQRESGVLTETERLGRAISEHEAVLAQLLTRIAPVVRNEPETANREGNTSPEATLCHVGSAIRDERRRLELITGVLRDLVRRIDL